MKFEEYLSSLRGKSVAVIGIGVSNQPLIRLLLDRGIQVTACDKKNREDLGELGDELERHGCCLQLGEDYLKDLTEDVIFRTPGLRPDVPELAAAVERGSRLTSEMEVFLRSAPVPRSPSPAPTARRRPPPSSQSCWRPPDAPSTWGATSATRCCATRRTSRPRTWRCWSSAPSS